MSKMSALERYAKRTYETRGLLHQRNLAVLRNYLGTTPEDDLRKEVYELTDLNLLKTLWEAGLKPRQQLWVLNRYEQIVGRRTE